MNKVPFSGIFMKKFFKGFTKINFIIWAACSVAILLSFFIFGNTQYHYLIGSLIGVTSLTFISKGHPFGQVLVLVFSVFYGVISYSFRYYGEMITYLCMSAPFAVIALVGWLKNPAGNGNAEVKINSLTKIDWILFGVLTVAVTVAFYFILRALNTANLIISTLSVFTSFSAAYLTSRRCRFYAICYSLNDIVLIVMWILASIEDISYLPMVVCFLSFLVLDGYGFINWSKMQKRQRNAEIINP